MTNERDCPNVLFLIGNGFDLAHDLKTRYQDFVIWYLRKAIERATELHPDPFWDKLTIVRNHGILYSEDHLQNLNSINALINSGRLSIEFKEPFFKELVESFTSRDWVDIEAYYFAKVLDAFDHYKKNRNKPLDQIKRLNLCLDVIKEYFADYLDTIEKPTVDDIIRSRITNEVRRNKFERGCFLVFNYTNTVDLYLSKTGLNSKQVINIHGKLNSPENPIIFGYGDERHSYYNLMEDVNENEFLRNMKSFGYFKSPNYQNLISFLDSEDYKVCIMGHSCGLSDRVLLSTIFGHENCTAIQIYFHQKPENETDFDQKVMEISRHFKPEEKALMRKRIISFKYSDSLS